MCGEERMATAFDLSRNWWVLLVRGVLAIIFGILAIVNPAVTLGVLVLFFGAYALADGILSIITALTAPRRYRGWVWLLVGGIAGVIIGLLTFFMPGVTAAALLYFMVAWLIVTGVMQAVAGIVLRKQMNGEFFLVIGGVLTALFGFYFLIYPGAGALAVIRLIGAGAIIFGTMMIVSAIRLRNWRTGGDPPMVTAAVEDEPAA